MSLWLYMCCFYTVFYSYTYSLRYLNICLLKKIHCAIYCFCTATKDIDSSLSNYMKCQFSFYGISRCFRLFHSYEQIWKYKWADYIF